MHMHLNFFPLFHLELIFYDFDSPTLVGQLQTFEIQQEGHSRHCCPANLGHYQVSITQVGESYSISFCLPIDACFFFLCFC
jgi:hypothetical protein